MTITTRDYDLLTVDPDDVTTARTWANQRALAARAVQQALTRQQQINNALAADPAVGLIAARTAAQRATADRQAEATTAQAQLDSATATADRFEHTDLVAAQAALDAATRAVADTLAQLLKEAQASTALTATVDGLALRDRYVQATAASPPTWDHATIPFRAHSGDLPLDPELPFPAIGDTDYAALLTVLDQLDGHVHAVADLVTAESVHQLVQGNAVRSGAALDVATTGHVPDDFDVVRTPRRGSEVTYRVLVVIDPAAGPRWGTVPGSAAAIADPVLNAWASQLLPDPKTVHVTARQVDAVTGAPGVALDLTLETLGLDPLGWVRLAQDPVEVQQRVARIARTRWASAYTGRIIVDNSAASAVSPPATLADLLIAASGVHDLMAASRALTAADFLLPAVPAPAVDAATATLVAARVAAVSQLVTNAATALESAAKGQDLGALTDALFAASALGDAAATPQLVGGVPDLASLRAQAATVLPRLRARTAGAPFSVDPSDLTGTLARGRERLALLCGFRLPLLTPLSLPAGGPWPQDLVGTQVRRAGTEPANLRTWLYAHARVRPAVQALLAMYDRAETLSTGAMQDVRATQLDVVGAPSQTNWVGTDPAPRDGSVAVVVQRSFSGNLPASVAGLAVDTWTHLVPAPTLATGVAFHYNEPNSTPAQAVLVAVSPDLRPERQPATWDLDTLLDVLTSTLALARDRAVAAELATLSGLTVPDAP